MRADTPDTPAPSALLSRLHSAIAQIFSPDVARMLAPTPTQDARQPAASADAQLEQIDLQQPMNEQLLRKLAARVRVERDRMLADMKRAASRGETETAATIKRRLDWFHRLIQQERWRELRCAVLLGKDPPMTDGGDVALLYPTPRE